MALQALVAKDATNTEKLKKNTNTVMSRLFMFDKNINLSIYISLFT